MGKRSKRRGRDRETERLRDREKEKLGDGERPARVFPNLAESVKGWRMRRKMRGAAYEIVKLLNC